MDSSPQTPQTPRRQNRSGEAEYAGPLTPTSPSSKSPESTRAAKRLKRSDGCSDSDEKITKFPQLVIEDCRVAGPIYLPLPVRRYGGVAERYQRAWDAGLETEVHQILSDCHISHPVVNLQKLITERSYASPRSAVYIFIEIFEPSDRPQRSTAANSILELCRDKGLDDLNVEIADPCGLMPKISATISPTWSIVPFWENLLLEIMNALKPNVDWLTIDLISRASWANFESRGSASFVPTILIMIKDNTEESYTSARDKICGLLDARFPEVAVEVIRGCLDGWADIEDYEPAFVHHGEKLWQEEAYMGASIQRDGSNGSGTLGCFIKLRDQQGVTQTYGLTNFHVVVPNPEEIISHDFLTQHWIKTGLLLGPSKSFQVNMPSKIDLDAARDGVVQLRKDFGGDMVDNNLGHKEYLSLEKEYSGWESQGQDPTTLMPKAAVHLVRHVRKQLLQCREQIDAIDARKNNLRLGQIFAGSGLRQTRSRQLVDWALISVDQTRIPARNDLPTKIHNIGIQSSNMGQIGRLDLHKRVFKIGRRSNETFGFVNPVVSTKLSAWWIDKNQLVYDYGRAWIVMDRMEEDEEGKMRGSPFFSDKGDSGSAVFSQNGEFVGLLHGGTYLERNRSYITAAQDLVEDIKYVTGAVEVSML